MRRNFFEFEERKGKNFTFWKFVIFYSVNQGQSQSSVERHSQCLRNAVDSAITDPVEARPHNRLVSSGESLIDENSRK
jgi:hypothetical protein